MGTPADVVKARIMNQPTDQFGKGENDFFMGTVCAVMCTHLLSSFQHLMLRA